MVLSRAKSRLWASGDLYFLPILPLFPLFSSPPFLSLRQCSACVWNVVFCGVLGLMAGVLSEKRAHVVARDSVDHVTAVQQGSPLTRASCTVKKNYWGRPWRGRPVQGKFFSWGRPSFVELGWLVLKSWT